MPGRSLGARGARSYPAGLVGSRGTRRARAAATPAAFREVLLRERHALERALTVPSCFAGIGNAYGDEILHRARLSPVTHTDRLEDEAISRHFEATRAVLGEWIERLRVQTGGGFPEQVTALRPEMAVHGRSRAPFPVCGAPMQRVVRAI